MNGVERIAAELTNRIRVFSLPERFIRNHRDVCVRPSFRKVSVAARENGRRRVYALKAVYSFVLYFNV